MLRGLPPSNPSPLFKAHAHPLPGLQSRIERQGGEYVLSGVKWWTSGACDPRCAVAIFMGKTDPGAAAHKQQSMVGMWHGWGFMAACRVC